MLSTGRPPVSLATLPRPRDKERESSLPSLSPSSPWSFRVTLSPESEPESDVEVVSGQNRPQSGVKAIKVYAQCLRPHLCYKTVVVTPHTTSKQVILGLLSRFRMRHRDPNLFYLTMDIVISRTGGPVSRTLVLDDDSRPAELTLCNPWGECKFTLQMKKGGLVRIYDSVLMNESKYKSLLISEETTVEDVVKILLHCYGLESFPLNKFCVYEHCKTQNYERKLNYEDRPLAVQDSWLDPQQFRLVLRRTPSLVPRRGSIHQLGLPNVPVHSHATTDMGARAIQASLVERYSKFCQKYESYFYV